MIEILKLSAGILILLLGIPIGYYLAKATKEELSSGKNWFKLIVIVSLIGSIASLFLKNDFMFFSFLFIAIVTSISLRKKK
tara:strand:+ start:2405 stop:2647 length:243 start_codon:yes stop_codon:yes gene_type:complete